VTEPVPCRPRLFRGGPYAWNGAISFGWERSFCRLGNLLVASLYKAVGASRAAERASLNPPDPWSSAAVGGLGMSASIGRRGEGGGSWRSRVRVFVIGGWWSSLRLAPTIDRGRIRLFAVQQLLSQAARHQHSSSLTSSLFVALTFRPARTDVTQQPGGGGGACGGAALIKSSRYRAKDGLTISTNAFFMHYYMMTGVHLFHLLLGLVILAILWRELDRTNAPRAQVMESGACYWHAIDLLWIVLFVLLYLMR
jgi:hypothetical protein